jgi:hypothetical protein
MSERYGLSYIDLNINPTNIDALRIVREAEAREAEVAPFNIVNKNIQELRAYMELLERNSTAGDIRPHFKIKTRHPNIYSNDWREVEQQFIKKADTQAYINYHCQHGIKEEWKIEKVQ